MKILLAVLPLILLVLSSCGRQTPPQGRVWAVEPGKNVTPGQRIPTPSGQERKYPNPDEGERGGGRWFQAQRQPNLSESEKRQIQQLESIGYVGGQHDPTGQVLVARYDEDHAYDGLNFYVSGHGPSAILCDMEGVVLHEWTFPFVQAFSMPIGPDSSYYRRAYLYDNGDILAIFEGQGIIKLDKDSNLLWKNPIKAHHDLQVMPNGDIYVLTRKGRMIREINPHRPILEDFISVLDAQGQEKRKVSVLEAVRNSGYAALFENSSVRGGDIFHTNTLTVLDGRFADRAPWFKKGNVLTSLLVLDAVVVIDMEQEAVVKAWMGTFKKQHDPHLLDDGNVLLFDNRGGEETSSVLEFDPVTSKVKWEFRGTVQEPFYTRTCGTAQRLPNGNTLVTESDYGRVIEVTRDGRVVWEFFNPYRAGPDDQYVAAVLEMTRKPADFGADWLNVHP
jgi:hypothetical protein